MIVRNSFADLQWSSEAKFLSIVNQHIPGGADFKKMYGFLFICRFLLNGESGKRKAGEVILKTMNSESPLGLTK